MLHWRALHICAAVAVLGAYPVGTWPKIFLLAGLAAHAVHRQPSSAGKLLRAADGSWLLPEQGGAGWRLDARTRHTSWWVHLVLTAPGRRHDCLLVRDQLAPALWSALIVGLETGSWRLPAFEPGC